MARDRILSGARAAVLARELHRLMAESLPGVPVTLALCEDTIRWDSLRGRCLEARAQRSIRDVSAVLGVPQYRLNAIEHGRLAEIRGDAAWTYFQFLGIDTWVARWCRANPELASRAGLASVKARTPADRSPRRERRPSANGRRAR